MSVAESLLVRDNSSAGNHSHRTASNHLVLIAYQAWGHARPLANLAVRLVQTRNTVVTFFTTPAYYDRIKAELLRDFDADEADLMDRLRLIALPHTGLNSLDNTVLNTAFAQAFEQLVNGKPLQCIYTGTEYEAGSRPKAVLIDFWGLSLLKAVRCSSGTEKPIKVFVWFAGGASIIFRLAGPERLGGIGNLLAKSTEEAARRQVDIGQAAGDIAYGIDGTVIHIPGFPPMYDYEIEPQIAGAPRSLTGIAGLAGHEALNACDGVILASPECYEPETVAALREWLSETSRPVYCVGPMVARGARADALDKQQSESTSEIDEFLASTLSRHGERSLLYISFGTVYWSTEPEKIWAFLDVVIELGIPFIMSHASPMTIVPVEVAEKVKKCGNGILTPYSPQQHVLNHPAMGWFLTHGGHNSVVEAICVGVPMIFWPFSFDQAFNAIHLTSLGVAYEIFNGRTGPGLRPILRLGRAPEGTLDAVREEAREVLRNAFGEDGKRKRERLRALQANVLDARSAQGSSTRDVQAFLDYV